MGGTSPARLHRDHSHDGTSKRTAAAAAAMAAAMAVVPDGPPLERSTSLNHPHSIEQQADDALLLASSQAQMSAVDR